MATGGDRKAACRLTATMVPNSTGSTLKCVSSGTKIGTKITMISVHSSGQPRKKMMSWAMSMNCSGDRSRPSTHCSMICCPPCSANTAENSAEPTNSQHTIAVVLAVRKVDCSQRADQAAVDSKKSQIQGAAVPTKRPPSAPEMIMVIVSPRSDIEPSDAPTMSPTRLAHSVSRRYFCVARRDTARRWSRCRPTPSPS